MPLLLAIQITEIKKIQKFKNKTTVTVTRFNVMLMKM